VFVVLLSAVVDHGDKWNETAMICGAAEVKHKFKKFRQKFPIPSIQTRKGSHIVCHFREY
jgi:hypothetical protein